MTSDRIHAGIAKVQKPAALVYLDDWNAVFEIPAQHGVGPVVRGCDPGRTYLLQFGLRAVHDLLITRLAADRIGLADQVPGADDVIKKHQNDEDDAGNNRRVGPRDGRLDHPCGKTLAREHRGDYLGAGNPHSAETYL